ncbi:MAG: hypothetical protein ACXABY_03580 [Candidatus Thorarchaeota archaeon]|jgi:hypothetical protein
MPKLVWSKQIGAYWQANTNTIGMPTEGVEREDFPCSLAHEIAHWRLGHNALNCRSLEAYNKQEVEAWKQTFKWLPPDEINLDAIGESLICSPIRFRNKVLALAKRAKNRT